MLLVKMLAAINKCNRDAEFAQVVLVRLNYFTVDVDLKYKGIL